MHGRDPLGSATYAYVLWPLDHRIGGQDFHMGSQDFRVGGQDFRMEGGDFHMSHVA